MQSIVYHQYFKDGSLLYRKARNTFGSNPKKNGNPNKKVWFEHLEGGKWLPGYSGEHVIYNRDEFSTADKSLTRILVEGEPKVDLLQIWGFIACSNDTGSNGQWPNDFPEMCSRCDIVILCDEDKPGWAWAERTAQLLYGYAKSIKILREWPC